MKTKTLIKKLADSRNDQAFRTKSQCAHVVIEKPTVTGDTVKVYIGDGDSDSDYQHLDAKDLRELAKKFKAVADLLDPPASSYDL